MIKTKFLIWLLLAFCSCVCTICLVCTIPAVTPIVSDDMSDLTFENPVETLSSTLSSVSEHLVPTSLEAEENLETSITSEVLEDVENSDDCETNTSKEEIENIPDIIELPVVLYNQHKEGFNMIDGADYLNDIATLLQKYAPKELRISAGCAMAYTEGGSGKKGLYTLTNNCFGIKAYSNWTGHVYSRSTGKVYKDYQTAKAYGAEGLFRAYNSMEESVVDYIELMTHSYYDEVLNVSSDAEYFNYVLQKGYGEFELYSTWLYVVDLYDLTQYNRNY